MQNIADEITPRTRVGFTIAALGSLLLLLGAGAVGLVGFTWNVSQTLNGMSNDINAIKVQVQAAASDRWTASDMDRWAAALANQNKTLDVPNPRRSRVQHDLTADR